MAAAPAMNHDQNRKRNQNKNTCTTEATDGNGPTTGVVFRVNLASLLFGRERRVLGPGLEVLHDVQLGVDEEVGSEPRDAHEVDGERLHVAVHLPREHKHRRLAEDIRHALGEAWHEQPVVIHQHEPVELGVGRHDGGRAEQVGLVYPPISGDHTRKKEAEAMDQIGVRALINYFARSNSW